MALGGMVQHETAPNGLFYCPETSNVMPRLSKSSQELLSGVSAFSTCGFGWFASVVSAHPTTRELTNQWLRCQLQGRVPL